MFCAYSSPKKGLLPPTELSAGEFLGLQLAREIARVIGMNDRTTLPTLLRDTAARLDAGAHYEWGHMGRCNCGHLVQTVTNMSCRQISAAVEHRLDEWTEHAKDYCQVTDSPVDQLFSALAEVGFSHRDVVALEYLSDPRVLARLGPQGPRLRRNHAPDVCLYMRTLADVIEESSQVPALRA
jgi:hypothetical protein